MHYCGWQFLELFLNFLMQICLLGRLQFKHEFLMLNKCFLEVVFKLFLLFLKLDFHLINIIKIVTNLKLSRTQTKS